MRPFPLVALLLAAGLRAQAPDTARSTDYLVFVAAEAADRISLIRFGPAGARVEREFPIGVLPTDPDGPHGVTVSPDRRFLYISTAHGTPFGSLWKFDAETGRPLARVELGNFPATVALTPDGQFAFIVNFNLHGDPAPSSVSVVETEQMFEIARVPTCVMPHGSRLNPQGTKQYSACMMDDELVEIDTRAFAVSRRFNLRGVAAASTASAPAPPPDGHAAHGPAAHDAPTCSPTWAEPSADGSAVFVACNKANEIVEIDAAAWRIARRFPAGNGVYNLAVTRDGRLLVATNKRGQSVSLFDLTSGREVARIPTSRQIVHGVALSPDDRYAFVSVEGIGAEPGTVEVVDLIGRKRVASVDVGQMAGGIDVWKSEPTRP